MIEPYSVDGHLHNFWFNRTELIPIDESECNVCMNAKYLVDVRVYMSQASNRN